jgi:hypothetical protein
MYNHSFKIYGSYEVLMDDFKTFLAMP